MAFGKRSHVPRTPVAAPRPPEPSPAQTQRERRRAAAAAGTCSMEAPGDAQSLWEVMGDLLTADDANAGSTTGGFFGCGDGGDGGGD